MPARRRSEGRRARSAAEVTANGFRLRPSASPVPAGHSRSPQRWPRSAMGLLPGAAGLRLPWRSAVRARFRPGAEPAAGSDWRGHEPQGRGAAQGAVLVRDRGEGGAVGQAGAPGDRAARAAEGAGLDGPRPGVGGNGGVA